MVYVDWGVLQSSSLQCHKINHCRFWLQFSSSSAKSKSVYPPSSLWQPVRSEQWWPPFRWPFHLKLLPPTISEKITLITIIGSQKIHPKLKNLSFCFSGFLGNGKRYWRSAGGKMIWVWELYSFSDLWISGFLTKIFACILRPERPKDANGEVQRPEEPPAKSLGPEGPLTSNMIYSIDICRSSLGFWHIDQRIVEYLDWYGPVTAQSSELKKTACYIESIQQWIYNNVKRIAA